MSFDMEETVASMNNIVSNINRTQTLVVPELTNFNNN